MIRLMVHSIIMNRTHSCQDMSFLEPLLFLDGLTVDSLPHISRRITDRATGTAELEFQTEDQARVACQVPSP